MRNIIVVGSLCLLVISCVGRQQQEMVVADLPYPPDDQLAYYQQQSDSGYQTFWMDIKATTSAFLNNSIYANQKVKPEQIRLVGEGVFNGQVRVDLGDSVLEVTLVRPFREKGKKSIWQVVAAQKKAWPKSGSESAK